jgi:hypothetical protein
VIVVSHPKQIVLGVDAEVFWEVVLDEEVLVMVEE